jgi:hypothetical protein
LNILLKSHPFVFLFFFLFTLTSVFSFPFIYFIFVIPGADHTPEDTVENVAESVNLAEEPAYAAVVAALSGQLRAGCAAALPREN